MKKFRYSFPISAYVIYALLMAVSAFSIIFASLRLAEVGKLVSVYPASDIVSIVVFAVFLVLMTLISFGTCYRLNDQAFVSDHVLFKKKIEWDRVLRYVIDEASGVSALYYLDPAVPDNVLFIVICIKASERQSFVDALKSFKPDLLIETNAKHE